MPIRAASLKTKPSGLVCVTQLTSPDPNVKDLGLRKVLFTSSAASYCPSDERSAKQADKDNAKQASFFVGTARAREVRDKIWDDPTVIGNLCKQCDPKSTNQWQCQDEKDPRISFVVKRAPLNEVSGSSGSGPWAIFVNSGSCHSFEPSGDFWATSPFPTDQTIRSVGFIKNCGLILLKDSSHITWSVVAGKRAIQQRLHERGRGENKDYDPNFYLTPHPGAYEHLQKWECGKQS
jgi:hypothetical protein